MLPPQLCIMLTDSIQTQTLTETLCSHTATFRWRVAGSDAGSAPSWWFHLRLQGNIWQDSGREEREAGVREEEDNSLTSVTFGEGDPWLI